MVTIENRTPSQRLNCRRCGGYVLPDVDGDLVCLMCGRPLRARRPSLDDAERPEHRHAA